MSAKDAAAFRQKLQGSTSLQKEVADEAAKNAEAGVIAIGKRLGFEFDQDEMYATLKNSELNEYELGLVGGGVGAGVGMFGNDCGKANTPNPGVNVTLNTTTNTGGG